MLEHCPPSAWNRVRHGVEYAVSAIIRMAQALGMRTTAEGVETAHQLTFLREQGCDEAQGFYFSRPLGAPHLQQYLLQRPA